MNKYVINWLYEKYVSWINVKFHQHGVYNTSFYNCNNLKFKSMAPINDRGEKIMNYICVEMLIL